MLYNVLNEINKLQGEIGLTTNELLGIIVINELDKRGISATSTNARRFGLSCAPNIFSNLKKRGIITPAHKTYAYKLSLSYKRMLTDLEERVAAQVAVDIKTNSNLGELKRNILKSEQNPEPSKAIAKSSSDSGKDISAKKGNIPSKLAKQLNCDLAGCE